MNDGESVRRTGPMALLLAVLAFLGIRSFTADPSAPPTERARSVREHPMETARGESDTATEASSSEAERLLRRLSAFQNARPASDFERALAGREKELPDLKDARFVIACVPDPAESGTGDRFDTLIDASQRAAERLGYVLDRYYYPWPNVKGPGKGVPADPVEVTGWQARQEKGGGKMPIPLSIQIQSLAEEKPWRRLPGMLLLRHLLNPAQPAAKSSELLLLLLVGETATSGLHKDAFLTSMRLVQRSREYQESGRVNVLGPCFSGSQTSLEKVVQAWAKEEKQARERRREVPTPDFHVISGGATAIERDRLQGICDGVKVKFQATVVPERAVIHALLEHLNLSSGESLAILQESNTAYGLGAIRRSNWNRGPIFFSFPLHVAEVRTAYEKATGASSEGASRLPTFGSKLRLRLRGANPSRETEPSLAPEMTAVTTERVLADMLETIARERIRYVLILATDVKDWLFLASLVREHCPEARLIFSDTDLLLSHPDFSADLRGSIVGSTYPLYPRNQSWSFPFGGRKERFVYPGPREQGSYNALIALLNPKAPHLLLEYGRPFSEEGGDRNSTCPASLAPPIWISIIGEGNLYPLKAVPIPEENGFRDYVFQAIPPNEADGAKPEFTPAHPGLWIVPSLAMFLLLLCLGRTYWSVRGANSTSPSAEDGGSSWKMKNLFRPGADDVRRRQQFYVFVCLTSVLAVCGYIAFVWLVPIVHWFRSGSPVVLRGWGWWVTPCILGAVVLVFLVLWGVCIVGWCRNLAVLIRAKPMRDLLNGLWEARGTWSPLLLMSVPLVVLFVAFFFQGNPVRLPTWDEMLLFSERATSLASGVTPVVPVLMLGIAFFCWGHCQLKRLFLLRDHAVTSPFPSEPPLLWFQDINNQDKEVGELLKDPLQAVRGMGVFLVWVVWFFALCRLFNHYVPTVEGVVTDVLLWLALGVLTLLIVYGWLHLRKVWEGLRKLLHAITLLPVEEAFTHIPAAVTSMFGPDLTSERPGRQGHLHHQLEQHKLLATEYQNIAASLAKGEDPIVPPDALANAMQPCPNDAKASRRMIATANACLLLLRQIWDNPRLTERFLSKPTGETAEVVSAAADSGSVITKTVSTEPPGGKSTMTIVEKIHPSKPDDDDKAVRRWLARVEDFVALEVTFYLSQFFVQLRNMALFLSLAPLLLLLAVTSYPLQPQRLWVLLAVALIGLVTLSVIWIVIQIERNELVSRILKTTPNQINFHWGFLSHLAIYALPLLGILVAMSSDLSDLVHAWVDPLLEVMR